MLKAKFLLASFPILLVAVSPCGIGTAYASTGDLACSANSQLNFTPPLTASNLSAQAFLTKGFVGCLSLDGKYSSLRSAYGAGTGTVSSAGVPCTPLLSLTLYGVITWSPTGEQSAFIEVIQTNPRSGQLVAYETVMSGPLAGDYVTFAGAVTPNLDCSLNGLSSLAVPLHAEVYG